MAPTEVLARQHLETIGPLADKAGLRIALLTGREKGRARKDVIDRLAAGDIDIIIGTHALFQADVVFRDLAFAVIDEQHRFGVHQRLQLQSKGNGSGTDVLVMTATPIPRTLVMTHYGDLDVSRLTEKPPGRKPIGSRVVCGHWSALGLFMGLGVHAIDTGCVWGGYLTALRLDSPVPQVVQVPACPERFRNGPDD